MTTTVAGCRWECWTMAALVLASGFQVWLSASCGVSVGGTKPWSLVSISPTCILSPEDHTLIWGARSAKTISMSQDAAAGFRSRQRKVGEMMSRGKTAPSWGKSTMRGDGVPADSGSAAANSRTVSFKRGINRCVQATGMPKGSGLFPAFRICLLGENTQSGDNTVHFGGADHRLRGVPPPTSAGRRHKPIVRPTRAGLPALQIAATREDLVG